MSEEKKETKSCPACVSIKPQMLLCRSWALALFFVLPIIMGFAFWYDMSKPNFRWSVGNFIVPSILATIWLNLFRLYFINIVLGRQYFIWLDASDRLHVHRTDWWQKLFNGKKMQLAPLPVGSVFEIWVGGWFRRSKVLDGDKHFGWSVKVTGTWFLFLPKWLVLTDFRGCSIHLAFSRCAAINRELDQEYINYALKLASAHQGLANALCDLESRQVSDGASAVAGQVGVNTA